MQNNYNNYLKRQKQASTNNFKEKIKNSLNGKAINNTTMPNTTQTAIQNKVKAMTPNSGVSTSTIGSGNVSGVVTPSNNVNNVNARTVTPNALEGQINASEAPSAVNVTTPVVENPAQPIDESGGAGLMSLSEINNALAPNTSNPNARTVTNTSNANARAVTYNPLDPNAIVPGTGGMTQAEYEAEVKRKQEAGIALDNPTLYQEYLNASTPYKYADQILQTQKDQANKNWQLQEEMFNQQQQNLKDQYNQSVKDAENAYNKSVDTLNEQRYNQREEMNVSGTKRGIQYSPQQLGLENVANINHNKNLAEASNSRNELLNKLQIEMNNSLAQLKMSHLQSYNSYQENIMKYQTDYYNQLMNWNREDSKTQSERDWEQKLLEEKRKWEEEQAQKDKDFQQQMQQLQNQFDKEMQDSQNNWQSGENALDRTHETNLNNSRSSGGGYSGYSGYSRSYTPYSRSYTPYSYGGYDSYDTTDEITQQAIDNKFKELSTDAYNATDMGYVGDVMQRASIYNDLISPMYDAYYGKNKTVDERLDNTRETALKHLLNKSIARSTNGTYQIGDTVYQNLRPLRQSHIDKVNKHKENLASRYYDKFSKNEGTKGRAKFKAKLETSRNIMNDIREKNKQEEKQNKSTKNTKNTKNTNTKSSKANEINKKFGAKNNERYTKESKATKAVKEVAKKVQKSTSNAAKNVKKNTNAKTSSTNTQKAIANSKKNSKTAGKNFINNLKKNVKKLLGKK